MNLKSLSNSNLIRELKSKVLEERKLLNEILELLHEVAVRRIYLDMAYPSLFEFSVKELGYSSSAAFRRIEAMRLLKSLPPESQKEIKSKISEGSLNLTHLASAQGFFKKEAKENKKVYSVQQKTEVLELLENKSKSDVEKELVKISPLAVPKKLETVRQLTEDKVSVTLTLDSDLMIKLQKLKALKSHVNPAMTLAELIGLLADQEIKRLEPKTLAKPVQSDDVKSNKSQALPLAAVKTRYIPTWVRAKVWQRDQGRCTFINHATGETCESRHFLQYDHIQEFSKQGSSTDPSNIRLLCGAHNRHRNFMTSE